jgi:hypothetical protein
MFSKKPHRRSLRSTFSPISVTLSRYDARRFRCLRGQPPMLGTRPVRTSTRHSEARPGPSRDAAVGKSPAQNKFFQLTFSALDIDLLLHVFIVVQATGLT